MSAESVSELAGPPEGARVYRQTVRAGFADCAPTGRVRLDAMARWLADVAYADVEDAGLAELAVWVVRRTRLEVRRFPRFGERLEVATFCSGLGRMWGERRTTISARDSAAADVETIALWVHLDPGTWRPAPFSEREAELYGAAAAGRRVTARLRHPAPDPEGEESTWTFRAVDTDIAGHVNNAAYWEPLEEQLVSSPAPEPVRIAAEIEFRGPAQPGEKTLIRREPWHWILTGGETHASILLADIARQGEDG